MPLVEDPRVDLVASPAPPATGRAIAEATGRRLAKTVMELGGKNALVVCDDADLDRAVEWALASAFSNAGQRCAAASRIVVFDAVYDAFRERLPRASSALDDVGPVISEASLERILDAVESGAGRRGDRARGGERLGDAGWHVAPTVVEGVAPDAPLSCEELFGPVATLYRVAAFDEAVALVNDSPYGLTAAIHTASIHRAMLFAERVAPASSSSTPGRTAASRTWGSAASRQSGTGWKEAGVEALDVYSETQYVNLVVDPARRERRPGGLSPEGLPRAVRGTDPFGASTLRPAVAWIGDARRPHRRRLRWHGAHRRGDPANGLTLVDGGARPSRIRRS